MKLVQTSNAPSAIGPYSQAVVANGIVYTSGQIALTPEGGDELLSEGVIVQAVRVMKNLEAVLIEAGSSLDDVLKIDFPFIKVVEIIEKKGIKEIVCEVCD